MFETSKSSLLWKITVLFVICCLYLPVQAKYGGGTGEPNDPYLIYTAEQMNAIGADSNDWDKHFKLMADIDLGAYTGTSFNIIGDYVSYNDPKNKPFTGVFNGNGHTITNFTYTSTGVNSIGLFGYVDDPNAEIRNLGLIDPNVDAWTRREVGSLVGWLDNGTVTNCYVKGCSVTGNRDIGGLVGYNHNGIITKCYAKSGSVSGSHHVGGLVGFNRYGTISNCYAEGGRIAGDKYIGGLVGENIHGTIINSYSTGSVSGNYWVGGLVGYNDGTITKCYSKVSVLGNYWVGGLVGRNGGTITNCYSTGSVSGIVDVGGLAGDNSQNAVITNCYSKCSVSGDDDVGGLVGYNIGEISNSYATGSVTGDDYVGGLVGDWKYGVVTDSFWDIETSGQATSDGGTGKTTAEMQTSGTFIAWGCDTVWTIDEGADYPRLVWENKPGELIVAPSYGGGSGEPNDPYLIYTAEQLNTIGLMHCHWDKHFKLMADIDLSNYTGTSFNIIGYWRSFDDEKSFKGVFDGSGHTISNFTYYISTVTGYLGLFGYVSGEIKNLGLIEPNVHAVSCLCFGSLVGVLDEGTMRNCYADGGSIVSYSQVGGLVGINYYGTIIDCNSSSSVSGGDDVGGLVGLNRDGTITNCYSTASVSGDKYVGGLVGYNSAGTIRNCCSTAGVLGDKDVGGLVGVNKDPITNCYATGSVSGDDCIGGLVGRNGSTIANCYARGTVSGQYRVGGLVGQNGAFFSVGIFGQWYPGVISNCYATGSVTGEGLVGFNEVGEITDSFWDIETSGQTTSAGGTGLPTAEMQMMSTFTDAGWDFVGETVNGIEDIWFIPKQDYPRLWWEGMQVPMKLTPGTLNCRSRGGWIKARLTLPEGFTVADVDSNILGWINPLGIEADYMDVFVDEDGFVRVDMAFDRAVLCEGLTGAGSVEITVGGFLTNGQYFYGTETMKIK